MSSSMYGTSGGVYPSDLARLEAIVEEHVLNNHDFSTANDIINKIKRELGLR